MKKRMISALAAMLALVMTAGCSENGGALSSGSSSSSTSSSSSSLESAESVSSSESTEQSSVESSSENVPVEVSSSVEDVVVPPVEVTADNMMNSIRLFDVISQGKENSMFSPLSLNMALGLLAEGAEGGSKSALNAYLGTENYSDFAEHYMQIVKGQYNYVSEYEDGWKNVFELANSFWANEKLPFKEDYQSRLTEKFGAEVRNIDFGDKTNALNAINGWVSEKTHKMIPSVINDYSEDIAAVLVNTVYFESAWRDKWSVYEDWKQPFTALDGSAKELPLMHNSGRSYFENAQATAFSCGYLNGLEFIGILPKETGDFSIESLDIPSLLESESFEYDVAAKMPRLEFETEIPLTATLKAFGLEEIFDPQRADFSGISDEALFVSDVLQKTKLELDENGTKAAAATVISIDTAAEPIEREKKEVTLDRPFAFMIYDSAEGQIVFLGKVTAP
ncbi:MAG: serpin family protein [Lachnospiraceae bacterium]|nr:serpin family protein [Ruminococcus sp.]MCM1274771.1 serpin family protein [Lachnospiraceae bacterium]